MGDNTKRKERTLDMKLEEIIFKLSHAKISYAESLSLWVCFLINKLKK